MEQLQAYGHPNGFLQFTLAKNYRLHIWSDDIPRQNIPTLIHNHTFSFISTVYMGYLQDIQYELVPTLHGDFQKYIAVCSESDKRVTKLVLASDQRYDVTVTEVRIIKPYESYKMLAGAFHQTHPLQFTVTCMKKTALNCQPYAEILVPYGKQPDNNFAGAQFSINFERD